MAEGEEDKMILIATTSSSTSSAPNLHVLESVDDLPVQVKLYSTSGLSLDIKDKCVDTGRRTMFLSYKDNVYCLGQFAPNLVVVPEGFCYLMGIASPANAPTVTASGTGITGTSICYITFVRRHPTSNRILHESSPSPSASVTLANQGRSWTNLPFITDLGITHLRGYVSHDGAAPRLAWEREIGITTVVESTATLSLGSLLKFEREPPPYGSVGAIYHDRLWLVDPEDPTRLWFSQQFEPESFTPLNYINLLDGERITALHKHGDVLLVWSKNCTYALTGWGIEDFVFRKISPTIGCISPYSIVDLYGATWFASKEGVIAYDGGFRNLMEDLDQSWKSDYAVNVTEFENSQAVIDEKRRAYKLQISGPNSFNFTYYWVGFYDALEERETSQPKWSFDVRDRSDTCHGVLRVSGESLDSVYTGSADGFVRRENVATNYNDDSDTHNKTMIVQFKHYFMGDAGQGSIFDGKNFTEIWPYVESENNTWRLFLHGGDEHAATDIPQWDDLDIPASAIAGKPPKTVHYFKPTGVSGRGLSVVIDAATPNNMKVRGFGGRYGPGTIGRHG